MMVRPFRLIGPVAFWLAAAAGSAGAQSAPPPGQPGVAAPPMQQSQNPVCSRLEAQLVSLDRGGDPRSEQIRRYEEAVQNQQSELDRMVMQARRAGCESSGFFLFGRSQAPQCGELNGRIQRMRGNLDKLNADLQQLQSGRGAIEGQRRQILMALGQNDCGPQYRQAAATPQQPRGFFDRLFGGGGGGGPTAPFGSGDLTPSDQTSAFRTICVRTCDGFYFPVSYSTSQANFRNDEQACQRMCPAAEVQLFSYRNPGEDVSNAVSMSGQPYNSLPNAYRYRQEYNPSCSCRRPGESWADALKSVDDTTVERGDIIVTDETAKQLSQPKADPRAPKQARAGAPAAPAPAETGSAAPTPVTSAPLQDATEPAAPDPTPPADQAKRTIRTVGPPFVAR